MKQETATTIDCTPLWAGLAPLFVRVLFLGSAKARADIQGELGRAARAVDAAYPHAKPDGYLSWELALPDIIRALNSRSRQRTLDAVGLVTTLCELADEV